MNAEIRLTNREAGLLCHSINLKVYVLVLLKDVQPNALNEHTA